MKKQIIAITIGITALIAVGCSVSYTFSGASISPEVKTATVIPFQNMATMVSPILAPTFNDELMNKIQRQTRLQQIREGGDVTFEGQIIDYRSDPVTISAGEFAQQNRLTVAIRVKFTNTKEPQYNFERNFSAYVDYPSSDMLTSVESTLVPEVVDKLIEDIFNAAFSNW